ncbi:MAG: hypothetical protein IJ945_08020 [Oscillospiraceae bacterium]|nr:hypothetical protein [Oscillospiraceae bacterium]
MLNLDLINKFRSMVNANSFTFFSYRKKLNKNHWNCICSAMDWITVSIEYLMEHPFSKRHDLNSIEIYAFISSVDILVEAVQQLHRVIFSTKVPPYKNDKDCFPNNPFNQTDLTFFKTIRACFGAHSVNLSEPGEENKTDKKRFASWSGCHFGEKSFSVILYSNQIKGEDISLSIDHNQILAFAEKHYNHLNVLIDELKRQHDAFCKEMRNVPFVWGTDPLSRLEILKRENEARMDNAYYRDLIDYLTLIFSTPVSCKENFDLIEKYHAALIKVIEKIEINLQKMTIEDFDFDDILYPTTKNLPDGWHYYVEKLSDYVFGNGYPPDIWLDQLKKIFNGLFEFKFNNYKELYVLIEAAIYSLSLDEKNDS